MADQAPTSAAAPSPAPAPKRGWLKAFLGAVGGIFSGACVMYFTAFVDKAVKPARPLPNFRSVASGLKVQFQNLSEGGSGWWDFGDGSPLEPVAADQPFVSHTYPRPGAYTVKMTLRNVLNEEAERSVSLRLDAEAAASEPPRILTLEAEPLSPGSCAPASFRLVSKVSNAQVCVLEVGDDQPLEVFTNPDSLAERLVTFPRPGGYLIKLAAVNGAQYDEKTEVVTVMEPPAGSAVAVLTVTGSADQIDTNLRPSTFGVAFPADSTADVFRVDLEEKAADGWSFADVRFKTPSGAEATLGPKTELALDSAALGLRDARNLNLQLSADRRSLRLTGELVRDPARGGQPCGLALPVVLVEQRRRAATALKPQQVSGPLPLPADGVSGTVTLPLPPLSKGWDRAKRRLELQVRDGDKVVWQDAGASHSGLIKLQGRACIITATPQGDQVRVDLLEAPALPAPAAWGGS
jgi:hypothetical protein